MLPLFLTLTEEEALQACKISRNDREYLVIADGDVVPDPDGGQWIIAAAEKERYVTVRVYPAEVPADEVSAYAFIKMQDEGGFAVYRSRERIGNPAAAELTPCEACGCGGKWKLRVSHMADDGSETFVRIAYEGERAEMYLGGELAADHFYTGQEWEVEVSGPAGAAARSGKGTGADAAHQKNNDDRRGRFENIG